VKRPEASVFDRCFPASFLSVHFLKFALKTITDFIIFLLDFFVYLLYMYYNRYTKILLKENFISGFIVQVVLTAAEKGLMA
jgi:hypothetical protein